MFIATSDVHGNLKNLVPFSQTLRKALEESRNNGCPLYIGGDLNDTKASLRSEFVGIVCDLFYEFKEIKKYVLVGNHDMNNHHNHTEHSLEFMRSLPETVVIDVPMFIMGDWYAIPYRHTNEEILAELEVAKSLGAKKLLLHQGIMSAKQSEYILDESSISIQDLADFDRVLLGHYHSHQTLGPKENITYFGSPFTVSFAEANQTKYIWLVDEDGAMTPIITGCREHKQFTWENEIPEKMPEVKEDSIVKVVLRGSKEFCLGTSKEEIQKMLGVNTLSIVPEITTKTTKRIEAEKVHKPMEVITDYLEQVDTSLDKEELRKYLNGAINADNQM